MEPQVCGSDSPGGKSGSRDGGARPGLAGDRAAADGRGAGDRCRPHTHRSVEDPAQINESGSLVQLVPKRPVGLEACSAMVVPATEIHTYCGNAPGCDVVTDTCTGASTVTMLSVHGGGQTPTTVNGSSKRPHPVTATPELTQTSPGMSPFHHPPTGVPETP